jgi:hypothetical protein
MKNHKSILFWAVVLLLGWLIWKRSKKSKVAENDAIQWMTEDSRTMELQTKLNVLAKQKGFAQVKEDGKLGDQTNNLLLKLFPEMDYVKQSGYLKASDYQIIST